jgi:hypothetical protein
MTSIHPAVALAAAAFASIATTLPAITCEAA